MNAAEICKAVLNIKRAATESELEDGVNILIESDEISFFVCEESSADERVSQYWVSKTIYPETNTVGLVEEAVLRLRQMVARDKENRKALAATWFFSASVNL